MEHYKKLLDYELIKFIMLSSNKITEKHNEKEIDDIYYNWLTPNDEFRKGLSSLNEEELLSFNKNMIGLLPMNRDYKQTFMTLDLLKFHLKDFILRKDLNIQEKKETKLKLTPLSFNDFLKLEDKKEYYVKDMFAKGTTNMIFSPPASMKSFISYYLGLCLVTGNPFLTQKTKKVNVGYFDWENPLSDVQNRVKGICKGMDFNMKEIDGFFFFPKQPTLLKVTNYDSFVIEELKDQLIEFIKENNIKVLFFDTLRRLGNFDENDSGAINTIKSELFDPLINECNVCIIFLHHTSKEGRNYRGSVDIEGILDTAFSINKKVNEDNINLTIKNTKRRNNELELLKTLVEIENNEFIDDDGDMLNIIKSVKFCKTAESENEEPNDYAQYRTYFMENLEFGKKYKNKNLVEELNYNFGVSSSKTTTKIIKWLVSINILKSFGEFKGKYYILNPIHADKEDEVKLKEMNKHILKLFIENDLVKIDLLKDKFEEKYYSILISEWISKGWLNTAKKDYLSITELFKSENISKSLEVEEVDCK